MPQPKNHLLRTVVPLVAVIAGVGIVISVLNNTSNQKSGTKPASAAAQTSPSAATLPAAAPITPPAGTATPPAGTATPPSTPATAADQPAGAQTPPPLAPAPAAPATPGLLDGLHAQVFAADTPAPTPLGSLNDQSDARFQVDFTPSGAGISSLRLTHHFETIKKEAHVQIQSEHALDVGDSKVTVAPFAATFAEIRTPGAPATAAPLATVNLFWDKAGPLWRQRDAATPGAFEAIIVNSAGTPVVRLERTYRFHPTQHDLLLDQRFTNLTSAPLEVRWYQFGPVDLPKDASSYGGDKRRVRFGYLLKPTIDPTREAVMSSDFVLPRDRELGPRSKATGLYEQMGQIWPRPESIKKEYELVWAGLTNRYFGVAVFPQIDLARTPKDKVLRSVQTINRLVLDPGHVSSTDRREILALQLVSAPVALRAGVPADLNLGIFAGPLAKKEIKADPLTKEAGLDDLVVYNFGGMCGFCTFDFVTSFLVWLLRTLHDYIVFDWALAVIVLVVCVRSILHPVTRWSQIRMQRFSKQMQSIQPKQKKLQEKHKDDKAKLQQETAKLWKETGISPLGMLGCLPMFLQTPVWVALYATLYFAVELRHQPAFFGVFQAISPGWSFLGDLAEPDRLVYFGRNVITVPMLGEIWSVNILPIILGVVFFIHQKFLTPPMQTMTPEQEAQQKMVKWMSVLMFPLFMYNAPSGLAIYFIANSTLGIFENMWIRKDIEKHGLADPDKMAAQRQAKAASGKGGWLQTIQNMAENQRKAAMKKATQTGKASRK